MKKTLLQLHASFGKQIETLENARIILKNEYAGIENVIDEIIDNIKTWYTMPELQERPHIINLWGLTGVGKTSLVLRLTEILGYDDRTFRLDLGEKDGNLSFRDTLQDLCENKDDAPIVIILDEFQHTRTIKGPFREEIENDRNRMVWELIDSGKVSYIDWKRGIWSFEDQIQLMRRLLFAGVEVENGIVTSGKELFLSEMYDKEDSDQPVLFISESDYHTILDYAGKQLKLELRSELKQHLLTLNGHESIEFLLNVVRIAQRPSVKNFTQSLIFILGNIDEAYHMAGNLTADISANEFHERSLKITVPDIKRALRSRFRDEQIARLGNLHIIYPALNEDAYNKIIEMELNKYANNITSRFNVALSFDNSLKMIIYREGVYPSQGARPLLTTIHQIVKSKVSSFFNYALTKSINPDHLHLIYENERMICEFYRNEKLVAKHSVSVSLNLERLRKPKLDDLQVIAAVHESGHAILSCILLKTYPEYILSVTSDPSIAGFVFSKKGRDFLSRKQLINRVAVNLGGLIAEELIFGEENVTAGNDKDIAAATEMILDLLKRHGFGSKPVLFAHSEHQDADAYHKVQDIEEEMMIILEQSRDLAMKTLNQERKLLLVMARHLSEQPRLDKDEIIEMVETYASTNVQLKTEEHYYRNMLFQHFQNVENHGQIIDSLPICMNKGVTE